MRTAVWIAVFLGMLLLFPVRAYAAEMPTQDEIYRGIAPSALEIPDDVQAVLDDAGISPEEPETFLLLTPRQFLESLWEKFRAEISAPVRLCGRLFAVTLLYGLLGGLGGTVAPDSLQGLTGTLFAVVCAGSAAEPLCTALMRTAGALAEGQVFMGSYVPVFSAFLAAGGSVAAGASYQVFVLFLTELIVQLGNGLLFPLLQISAACGIVDAVSPELGMGTAVGICRKTTTWVLGTVMALFSALLSFRGVVASAADSLASKAVRLVGSAMIPIVGSAVSEAYGTVQGSIILLRNGTGAAGMLVILWLALPPLISLLCYRAVFALAAAFADLTDAGALARLFRNTQGVLAAAFALLVCFAVMLIISTALMLLLIRNA